MDPGALFHWFADTQPAREFVASVYSRPGVTAKGNLPATLSHSSLCRGLAGLGYTLDDREAVISSFARAIAASRLGWMFSFPR